MHRAGQIDSGDAANAVPVRLGRERWVGERDPRSRLRRAVRKKREALLHVEWTAAACKTGDRDPGFTRDASQAG